MSVQWCVLIHRSSSHWAFCSGGWRGRRPGADGGTQESRGRSWRQRRGGGGGRGWSRRRGQGDGGRYRTFGRAWGERQQSRGRRSGPQLLHRQLHLHINQPSRWCSVLSCFQSVPVCTPPERPSPRPHPPKVGDARPITALHSSSLTWRGTLTFKILFYFITLRKYTKTRLKIPKSGGKLYLPPSGWMQYRSL